VGSCAECDVVAGAGIYVPAFLRNKKIIPITDLNTEQRGQIAFIRGDCKVVQRLSDLGLTLGTNVSLLRKTPMDGPVEILVRRTRLAIDHAIAENIFIESPVVGEA
jgi:DtxR family Mn-dependent transcriptional regulator